MDWGPSHWLPQENSPKWPAGVYDEITAWLKQNNHSIGQLKSQLQKFKAQKYPQLGPSAMVVSTAASVRASCHARVWDLNKVARAAVADVVGGPLCCSALDFLHYRDAVSALMNAKPNNLIGYCKLYLCLLIDHVAAWRTATVADLNATESSFQETRAACRNKERAIWASGAVGSAGPRTRLVSGILPLIRTATQPATVSTRKNAAAMVFVEIELRLHRRLAKALETASTPGDMHFPEDDWRPYDSESSTAATVYYVAGWTVANQCKLVHRSRLSTTYGTDRQHAEQTSFNDHWSSLASMAKAGAKELGFPVSKADRMGRNNGGSSYESVYATAEQYHFVTYLEKTIVQNLARDSFCKVHGGSSLSAIKAGLVGSRAAQVLLLKTFGAPEDFPIEYCDWGDAVVVESSDDEDEVDDTDEAQTEDPIWVRHDLFSTLYVSLLDFYFRMRGKDYVARINGKRSTADMATKSTSFRSVISMGGTKRIKMGDAAPPLAPSTGSWIETKDQLGRSYFWHTATRATCWVLPTGKEEAGAEDTEDAGAEVADAELVAALDDAELMDAVDAVEADQLVRRSNRCNKGQRRAVR